MEDTQIKQLVEMILEMRQEMMNAGLSVTNGQRTALIAATDALLHRLVEQDVKAA